MLNSCKMFQKQSEVSDFSRVYSNCCCSCWFEPEILKIGQSSHKMYSNKMLKFQESRTILNAYTKMSGNLLNAPYTYIYIWGRDGTSAIQNGTKKKPLSVSAARYKKNQPFPFLLLKLLLKLLLTCDKRPCFWIISNVLKLLCNQLIMILQVQLVLDMSLHEVMPLIFRILTFLVHQSVLYLQHQNHNF